MGFRVGAISGCLLVAVATVGAARQKSSLEPPGYSRIQLSRGPQNHLVVRGTVHGKPASFLIDTGATISFLRSDRAKEWNVRTSGEETNRSGRTFPLAPLNGLVLGGIPFEVANVALTSASHFRGTLRGGGAADGVLGLDLLRRQGAVINCRTREVFFKTAPNDRLNLEGATSALGFVGIPLEQDRAGGLKVACTLQGRPGRLVVDTGAFVTGIDDDAARTLGLTTRPSRLTTHGFDGRVRPIDLAQIDDLRIGGVRITPQPLAVMDLFGPRKALRTYTGLGRIEYYAPRTKGVEVFGVLGNELLDQRQAIIDLERMRLFLK